MHIICLDMEGVLLPEIWIHAAKRFRLDALKLTTRDWPDYDKLMKYRLKILRKEKIRLADLQKIIGELEPLPGAAAFMKKIRALYPVIILSDTYYEFAQPLMKKLGDATLFCNWLKTDKAGYISDYVLRQKDGKRKAVIALKKIGFSVAAAGDSYNDLTMLKVADKGVLYNPPASILKSHPQFPVAKNHDQLFKLLK
jgi:phosphoserine / homoserine phosphotransferase